jgi:hypothetical protein
MDVEEQSLYLCETYNTHEIECLIESLKKHVQKQFRHFVINDNDTVRTRVCELIDEGCLQYTRVIDNGQLYIYTGRTIKYSVKKLNELLGLIGERAASVKKTPFQKNDADVTFQHGKKMNLYHKPRYENDSSASTIRNLIIETIQEYTSRNQESITG